MEMDLTPRDYFQPPCDFYPSSSRVDIHFQQGEIVLSLKGFTFI